MKNVLKAFGIFSMVLIIGFSFVACGKDEDGGGGGGDDFRNDSYDTIYTGTWTGIGTTYFSKISTFDNTGYWSINATGTNSYGSAVGIKASAEYYLDEQGTAIIRFKRDFGRYDYGMATIEDGILTIKLDQGNGGDWIFTFTSKS